MSTGIKINYNYMEQIGKVFYLEEAEPYISPKRKKSRRAIFLCHCGKKFETYIYSVKHKRTTSCGCNRRTHRLGKEKIYKVWEHMKRRCDNPKCSVYEYYGARGITYCKKWKTFEGFYEDMGKTWKKELTIDQINTDENYNKKNCRWTTRTIQSRNVRKKKNNTSGYVGVHFLKNKKKWCSRIGINREKIYLGLFYSKIEAAKVRDKYITENNLEGFPLNFPKQKQRSI